MTRPVAPFLELLTEKRIHSVKVSVGDRLYRTLQDLAARPTAPSVTTSTIACSWTPSGSIWRCTPASQRIRWPRPTRSDPMALLTEFERARHVARIAEWLERLNHVPRDQVLAVERAMSTPPPDPRGSFQFSGRTERALP